MDAWVDLQCWKDGCDEMSTGEPRPAQIKRDSCFRRQSHGTLHNDPVPPPHTSVPHHSCGFFGSLISTPTAQRLTPPYRLLDTKQACP
jgi:hypothetical protein